MAAPASARAKGGDSRRMDKKKESHLTESGPETGDPEESRDGRARGQVE